MADGWTGCRFSPSALWLALSIGEPEGQIARDVKAVGDGGGDELRRGRVLIGGDFSLNFVDNVLLIQTPLMPLTMILQVV